MAIKVFDVSLFKHEPSVKNLMVDFSILKADLAARSGTADHIKTWPFDRTSSAPDSAGFRIHNPKTGSYTTWRISHTSFASGSGFILGWQLRPTEKTVEEYPATREYIIQVIND